MEHAYAFIVLDDKGRAYHPVRGGTVARYDPKTKKLERLTMTIDGKPARKQFTERPRRSRTGTRRPTARRCTCVEMSTNAAVRVRPDGDGRRRCPASRSASCLPRTDKPQRPTAGRCASAPTARCGRRSPNTACTGRAAAAPGELHARRQGAARPRAGRRRQPGLHDVHRRRTASRSRGTTRCRKRKDGTLTPVAADGRLRHERRQRLRADHRAVHADASTRRSS